jgi:hypothetical protein
MRHRRQTSAVATPTYCSFTMPMARSALNVDRFIVDHLSQDGL